MYLTPHHVGLIVSDIEKSKAFYAALGFELDVERSDDDKTLCFMRLGSFELELFCFKQPVATCVHEGRVIGFRHFALRTDDLDEVIRELAEKGIIPADVSVREVPGLARLLYFPDPDGIDIEVMQPL